MSQVQISDLSPEAIQYRALQKDFRLKECEYPVIKETDNAVLFQNEKDREQSKIWVPKKIIQEVNSKDFGRKIFFPCYVFKNFK